MASSPRYGSSLHSSATKGEELTLGHSESEQSFDFFNGKISESKVYSLEWRTGPAKPWQPATSTFGLPILDLLLLQLATPGVAWGEPFSRIAEANTVNKFNKGKGSAVYSLSYGFYCGDE